MQKYLLSILNQISLQYKALQQKCWYLQLQVHSVQLQWL